jgi:hypothetical protein
MTSKPEDQSADVVGSLASKEASPTAARRRQRG